MTSVLVIGGARSGKSRYAEARLEALPGDAALAYIATAQPLDTEMAERIAHHRARRGPRWHTMEAPLDLPAAIARAQGGADAVLVDCLTLWLTNVMLADHDVACAAEALIDALQRCTCPIVLIANEVGLGIVPDNALARRFRDHAGWLNQKLAVVADEVVLVAAGLPLHLKTLAGRA
jgi:adenosylcobinamide kinase/adenosylcobinamide-phosphate guanylyltransferase